MFIKNKEIIRISVSIARILKPQTKNNDRTSLTFSSSGQARGLVIQAQAIILLLFRADLSGPVPKIGPDGAIAGFLFNKSLRPKPDFRA